MAFWMECASIIPTGCAIRDNISSGCDRALPQAWILAEKILEPGESLRSSWPIAGTTGYDFLNMCNGLLVYGEGLNELTEIYSNFTGERQDFESLAHAKKLNVEHEALGSDVNRLAQLFVEICENNRDRRDYTRAEIRRAIREVAASFSVYRTYVVPERNEITEEDEQEIRNAVEIAKTHRTDVAPDLFDFIGDVLTLRQPRRSGDRVSAALSAVHFSRDGEGR